MGVPHGSHYTMFSGFFYKKPSVKCLFVCIILMPMWYLSKVTLP